MVPGPTNENPPWGDPFYPPRHQKVVTQRGDLTPPFPREGMTPAPKGERFFWPPLNSLRENSRGPRNPGVGLNPARS